MLNPLGRDREQHFSGAGEGPDTAAHAPVNFHAYAACTGGSFFRETARAIAARNPVLLLLKPSFRESERALTALKKAGLRVVVSLKETGLHQIADQLQDAVQLSRLLRIFEAADGYLAPTPEAADIMRTIRRDPNTVAFIPTPYPLPDPRWDFTRPVEHKHGIFVGTREFKILSRNHAAALFAAREISHTTGARVTVYNSERRKGERLLREIGFSPNRLRVLKEGVGYAEYLRVMAEHKLVFQMDTSFVPGQVAGDALLCRMPCVGGNGTIDRLAHPATCGAGRSGNELSEIAIRLLCDAEFYERHGRRITTPRRRAAVVRRRGRAARAVRWQPEELTSPHRAGFAAGSVEPAADFTIAISVALIAPVIATSMRKFAAVIG